MEASEAREEETRERIALRDEVKGNRGARSYSLGK